MLRPLLKSVVWLMGLPVLVAPLAAQPLDLVAPSLPAASHFAEAAAGWQQIVGPENGRPLDHTRALALVRWAICLRAAGQHGPAESLLQRILAIEPRVVQRGDGALPRALLALATIEMLRQQPAVAEALFSHGLGLSVAALGQDHETSRQFIWGLLALEIDARNKADGADPAPARGEGGPSAEEAIRSTAREGLRP